MDQFRVPEIVPANSLTRRRLLQGALGTAALVAAPGVLAACGGSSSSGSTTGGGGSAGTVGGTLHYLGWQGGDYQELLAPWKKKNDVKIESSFIGNMSDIAAKYAAGGGDEYDIICFSSNGTYRLGGSGVPFIALDLDQLPNRDGMTKWFLEAPGNESFLNEDGDVVAVPTTWGAIGICYDETAVKAPTAWADLMTPEFKGKYTIVDDPSTCFGIAGATLGYKANEMTQEEFEKTKEYLTEVVAGAKAFAPSFGDMATQLASGDVVAGAFGFSSVNAFAAEAGNNNIKTQIFLEEGSGSFTECYGIPSTGANPATAYSMINELLTVPNNAEAANTILLAPTIADAWSKVNSTVKSLFPENEAKIEEFLESAPIIPDPPAQSEEFVTFGDFTQGWTEVKAAAA
ncbi:MAG: ABC transporter substrate-binding protein [Solirubrobacterales bacterium]